MQLNALSQQQLPRWSALPLAAVCAKQWCPHALLVLKEEEKQRRVQWGRPPWWRVASEGRG